jgi:hypothetical protein
MSIDVITKETFSLSLPGPISQETRIGTERLMPEFIVPMAPALDGRALIL